MNVFERLGIHKGIFLAPMEDVTDIPYRLMCKQYGADMAYTEFVNADGLVRSKKPAKTHEKLRILNEERPVGIQIYGGDIETMIPAAAIAESYSPEVLDINAGCWVKKVATRGAGAGLLRDMPHMVKMAKAIVDRVSIPVTVKTRLGWDTKSITIVELAKMLQDVGVQALTVHCRTREQGHNGAADWSWIDKVKAAVDIPIVLNGDVNDPVSVKRAFDTTSCDAVMIARGAIGNPWVFRDAKRYMATGTLPPLPAMRERVETAIEHLRMEIQRKGEERAVLEMRKYYAGYFHGLPRNRGLRAALMQPMSRAAIEDLLYSFLWYEEPMAA